MNRLRWPLAFLAAVLAVAVGLFGAAPASAATPPAAGTVVGVSVSISAGQRLGNELPRPGIVVATGVAAEAAAAPRAWSNLAPSDPLFPGRTVPLDRLSSVNGRFQYVVREDGSLVVGRGGHIDLSRGSDVLAAGEVRVVNGEVRMLNNASGHYRPDGSIAGVAGTAFEQQTGLVVRGNAWQPVAHEGG